ncbi:FAD-dependent monooxygenase [Paraburkholderia caffeinilytica]|uniref:FAD-dependent monooxygenase n=1 Tax=Paraburkholderia caffeinilytica TaxID=1761016 RepID=UPI0038BD1972
MESIGPFRYERHIPLLPALDAGRDVKKHQVAICGGGPVGLATALGLARYGVPSVVIEADDTVCMGSRAACISRRSLQILERLGVLDAVMSKGLAWTSGRSFYRQTEVFRFDMPHDDTQKLPPMVNLQQYYIEQFLVDEIRANYADLIDIRWGSAVTGMTTAAHGVTLQVENSAGAYELDAAWLVACDGGQSFVRKRLGLPLAGAAYEGKYVIVDIELRSADPAERRAWFDPPSNPGWTMLLHKQPDDLWRIDYQVPDDTDIDSAITPEAVTPYVQRQLELIGQAHLPWKLVWTSAYRAGAMSLEKYRHGRILFAGNAAHAMPIFGVRGLNSGFDDADNLAWKLAAVVQGWGGDALLDSYSVERVHAFHVNAESARRSTEFMAPPSRGYSLMREAALSLAEKHRDIAKLVNPRQTSAIDYADSPLSSGTGLTNAPRVGQVIPDVPVSGSCGERFLSDALGQHFTVLAFGHGHDDLSVLADTESSPVSVVQVLFDDQAKGDASQPAWHCANTLIDRVGTLASRFGAVDADVWLVRPDGHLGAAWNRPSLATVRAALRKASGRAADFHQTVSEDHHVDA